ncbi:MAG: cardiolipin synthase [Rubripirellula sp.]
MAFETALANHWLVLGVVAGSMLLFGVIYSVLHSLRYVRTSQAAVAWTVGLLTLPVLALPLYWIFARHRFEGYREAIREVTTRYQQATHTVHDGLRTENYVRSTNQRTALEQVADILDTPLSRSDEFELLIDGEEFYEAVFKAIESADHYIYVEFYIIRDDDLGNEFAKRLIDRARSGICVRVVYDEVGCLRLSNAYLSRLREAGVEVQAFNTRQGWVNRFQINFRNHRKLVVVDGETAIVGGLNIGDEYVGKSSSLGVWRDTGLRVTGPIAKKVQAVFAGDYYWAARKNLPEAESADHAASAEQADRNAERPNAVCCATGPSDLRPRATMMFSALATAAKSRLWICTPYLVPDESAIVALHMARARGVDVRVLIPSKADHLGVFLAGYHYEYEFAEAKIPVFRYTAGFMHQKCVLVDDSLALIGSTNLDNRSLHLNFELMIAVEQRELVGQVAAMLETDFRNATSSDAGPKRWWFERAGTAVARLFSPIL